MLHGRFFLSSRWLFALSSLSSTVFEAAALLGVIKIARRGRRNRCTTECLCCKHVPSKRERSISRSLPGRWGLEVAWLFAWWSDDVSQSFQSFAHVLPICLAAAKMSAAKLHLSAFQHTSSAAKPSEWQFWNAQNVRKFFITSELRAKAYRNSPANKTNIFPLA